MSAQQGRTLVVLGGGGTLGAFQAGALWALAEQGILPDALYGCSAGSLNAAFFAAAPSVERAQALAQWWSDPRVQGVIAPSWWGRTGAIAAAVRHRGAGMLNPEPLRRLVRENVPAHDLSELALPVTVTTTCLDCGSAVHHDRGPIEDVLAASCALPGIFPPPKLPDGHRHVDGGVVCGVPVAPALAAAGPDDRILVLDCGLAPVTSRPGICAAHPSAAHPSADTDERLVQACGLVAHRRRLYQPPRELRRGAVNVVLDSFTIARTVANRASVADAMADARVQILPHVADAWAAGYLPTLPAGPRDCSVAEYLVSAGYAATHDWLRTASPTTPAR